MAMRVVTRVGAELIRGLNHALDGGLISVKEWEYAMIETYIKSTVDTGNTQCAYHWLQGCQPAQWAYLDDHWSTVDDVYYGYLCERHAESESESHFGSPRNLVPLADGVYIPDLHRVIKANWDTYCRMSRVHKGEIWY